MTKRRLLFAAAVLALLLAVGWAQAAAVPQKNGAAVITPTGGTIELPDSLLMIDEEAFAGTAAQTVILPDGLSRLGARSFADIRTLTTVFIPASTETIGRDAFLGSGDLRICAAAGPNAAEQ